MAEFSGFTKDKNNLLLVSGILHSSRAFLGPEVLHIDLTNHCNFNCIACWCRSPLLGDKAMPEEEKALVLPLDLVIGVLDDIREMGGLKQVKLVGGGEPFMHTDILKIIEYIKAIDKNIQVDINTNCSLVNEKTVEQLLRLGVDSLTVSIWAGSPEAYVAVHPNQREETFGRIRDILKLIFEEKKKRNWFHPRIIIHDVVFNLNYRDIDNMLAFGLDIGADNIQFVPVDPVKGRTDQLVLNQKEKKELLERLYEIRKRYDPLSFRYSSQDGRFIELSEFDGFIQRIEKLNIASGAYDEGVIEEFPCYVGWLFARIMTTGNVVPCCKGHRMPMGNIFKNRFRDIWLSGTYNEFRYNGINLSKCDPYFSRIGNDAVSKTGCYNCDNLWQNIPLHKKLTQLKDKNPQLLSFCAAFLKQIFKNDQ